MKTYIHRIPVCLLLLLVLGLGSSHVKAQFSETGIRFNRFSFDQENNSSDIDGTFINRPNRTSIFSLDFFLQQDKENHYVRYSAGFGSSKSYNERNFEIGETDFKNYSTNSQLNLRVRYEIGRSWSFLERFRVQTGLAGSFGKEIRGKNFSTAPTLDNLGVTNGYYESTQVYNGPFSLSGHMVLRADVNVFKQLSVGLEVQYGLSTSYQFSNYTRTYISFDLNDNEISSSETGYQYREFRISRPRLNSPFLNLTYTFGKSN